MPLLKGTLDVLALKALSWSAMHGFEIAQWLKDRSAGQFTIEQPALLQALHRMEERGLVVGEWGVSENNRRARYYRVTSAGRAHLRAETASLSGSVAALTAILSSRGS